MTKKTAASTLHCALGCAIVCSLVLTAGCPSGPTAPAIGLSTSSLTFTGFEFGANPADQTIQLTNAGVGTLGWTLTDDADWLFVTPTEGTTTAESVDLSVSVDTVGLTAALSPYTAQITVSASGASNTPRTVNVTLTLTAVTCEALSGSITTDTTLSLPCYIAESDISVSDATLTINPGVTLRFQQGNDMTVSSGGRLSAVGTSAQPIVFTGVEAIRGYWGGLRFYQSNSMDNHLDHVTIEYGGGYHDANLYLGGTSSSPTRVRVTNCTLRESETYGFYFDTYTVVEAFSANTITGNTLGAGNLAPDVTGHLDDTSTYTGNDEDVVAVWGGTVYADQTWPGIDADYLFTGDITVSAALTIEPGARLTFESGQDMTVNEDGSLTAVGTAGDPIVFSGEEGIRGYWGGLRLYQSNSTDNQLDHVTIEYGGGYHNGNLHLGGSSSSPVRLRVTNCTLRDSGTYGFYFDVYAVVDEFSSNTITGNTLGAGNAAADVVGYLDDTSTYTGNDADVVAVWGSTVYTEQTWAGIDADYLFTGDITVSAALTIEPGARLVFQDGQDMTVNEDGALAAVGAEQDPIVFTGEEQTPGYWGGLRYYQSNSATNQLDWVTIEYGGGYHNANLHLSGSSSSAVQLTAANCTFQESETCGAYLGSYITVNADFEEANDFFNNAGDDVCTD